MAKKAETYQKIMEMARNYGVADNALFIAAAEQYETQQKVIRLIKAAIDDAEELTTGKTYLKGTENLYANPLLKELPKHADSATATLKIMMDLIVKLGRKPQPIESKLQALIDAE